MTGGDRLTARLAPVTLVVGKGGVGKTTFAAALARYFASRGQRTLVVTTDPAATLLSAFGKPIAPTPAPINVAVGGQQLAVWAIDTQRVRDGFLARWREPMTQILDRGTYLDVDDVRALVDATLPGADEIFALLAIGDVFARATAEAYDRVVIDTAPTGHTLRLLNLPRSFAAVVRLLDAMQEKHRFMVRALTRRYRSDAADALIAELRQRVDALLQTLTDPKRTAAVLVTRPEPVVIAESARYFDALAESHIAVAAIVVNAWHDEDEERAAVRPLTERGEHRGVFVAPFREVHVIEGLLDSINALEPNAGPKSRTPKSPRAPQTSAPSASGGLPRLARSITIVAGKGGVGKTTVACAIAIAVSDSGEKTLLVSTDPAPSISDAMSQPIGDTEVVVAGAERIVARQMDATAAFAALRDQYQDRIDTVFENITGRGMELTHDRQILRDLLALAPPGIDELYALTVLGGTMDDGRFTRIIVDPAPTGHLLRLLDMPALAIAWSHQLMRLMLKYKDVIGLGDAARDLLTFARQTRTFEQRLHDADHTSAVLVALDEPLVRGESERLLAALGDRDVPVTGIIWNRGTSSTLPLPTHEVVPQYFAPLSSPAPVGVDAIREWSRRWGMLSK